MKMTIRMAACAAALAGLVAMPLGAQTHDGSIGLHGSWISPGQFAEGPGTELSIDDGFGWGGGLEWWMGAGRLGVSLNANYISNSLYADFENGTESPDFEESDTWFADASLMLRLLDPQPGRSFAPFVSLGLGAVRVDVEGDGNWSYAPADAQIDRRAHTQLGIAAGIGADFFVGRNLALRVEGKDYYMPESPFRSIATGNKHEGGNNWQFNVGVRYFWGGSEPEDFVFPREEEEDIIEPEPQAEPEPEPEIVRENVRMCVLEADGDLVWVDAVRVPSEGRTYVVRNGRDVVFSTVYPADRPLYVETADWYVANEPFTLDLLEEDAEELDERLEDEGIDVDIDAEDFEANRIEFVTFGPTRTMAPADLVYLGSVDGTPVYARPGDVTEIRTDLVTWHERSTDLRVILRRDAELAEAIGDLDPVFVAVEPGNPCVFRALRPTRVVRATTG